MIKFRLFSFILLVGFIIQVVPVAEVFGEWKPDSRFWQLLEPYSDALDNKDDLKIISAGINLYGYFKAEGTPEEAAKLRFENGDKDHIGYCRNIAWNVALAYERNGNYQNAAEYFKIALAYHSYYGLMYNNEQGFNQIDQDFMRTEMTNKINTYTPVFDIYTEVAANPLDGVYHGAKHEPKYGLYYGLVSDYDPQTKKHNNELANSNEKRASGVLIYIHFPSEKISDFKWIFDEYNDKCDVIEVAWNLPGEGSALKDVLKQRDYIIDAANFLKSVDKKIILRFGAEMNVWQDAPDPSDYIAAYRFIANIVKNTAPNVAMVFSPNDISAVGMDYDMFYPGDDYVDWVGVSLYNSKYFLGKKDIDKGQKAIYGVDDYANPIQRLRAIVEAYGGKKPIMISEGGVETYSNTNKEYTTDWAATMISRYYAYIPMIYPEVKAIFYFDVNFNNDKKTSTYSIYTSPKINQIYKNLTNNEIYIPMGKTESSIIYKKADDVSVQASNVKLHAYAMFFKNYNINVTYKVDNEIKAVSSAIPYTAVLDLSGYDDGEHIIKIEAYDTNGSLLMEKTISAVKSGAIIKLN